MVVARVFILLVALNILWSLRYFWDRRDSDAPGKFSFMLTTKDCPSHGGALFTCNLQELLACSAIIRGDMEGLNEGNLSIYLKGSRREALLEAYYLDATKDCSAYIEDRGFPTATLSDEERDFPIAYSMVIHQQIEMFERLLRATYAPQNVYCIHVDLKSPPSFTEAVEAIISCFPNVFMASKRESIVYASWSRVQADLTA